VHQLAVEVSTNSPRAKGAAELVLHLVAVVVSPLKLGHDEHILLITRLLVPINIFILLLLNRKKYENL
jgi:hypothetical protein